jgi:hypothetical protein
MDQDHPRLKTIRDLVIEMYTDPNDPMTIAEISRELRIGRETVREHLIRANVPRRAQKARGSRDEEMVTEAVRRYREGSETLWDIANDLGKTATTVRSWLIEAGVERRRPGVRVDPDSLRETIRLYQSGLTIDKVAEKQELHPWTVRQRLVDADIPRRRRGCPGTNQLPSEDMQDAGEAFAELVAAINPDLKAGPFRAGTDVQTVSDTESGGDGDDQVVGGLMDDMQLRE